LVEQVEMAARMEALQPLVRPLAAAAVQPRTKIQELVE
jgi:hypothetical protein